MEQTAEDPSANQQALALVGFGAAAFIAAGIGGLLTSRGVNGWYRTLRKPPFTPPDAVFGPVWSVLYALMALSGWLAWRSRREREGQRTLPLWWGQLALNVAWSGLFFAAKKPAFAFFELVALWGAIAATTRQSWNRSTVSGLLFLPYLAWVTFAGYLNYRLWRLNR